MPSSTTMAAAIGSLLAVTVLLVACSDARVVGPLATLPTPSGYSENVGLPQPDGLTLRGHFFAPANQTAVILAHQWQGDQRAWFEFAQTLADEGYAVFTFDFRGHGETGGETDAGLLDDDLLAAIKFLRDRGKQRIILVGASMGGTTSLVVSEQADVLAVVALSPPAQFEDQDALAAVPSLTKPKLLIATKGDAPSLSFEELVAAAAQPKDSELYPGTAHGTGILCQPACPDDQSTSIAAAVQQRILAFLAAQRTP